MCRQLIYTPLAVLRGEHPLIGCSERKKRRSTVRQLGMAEDYGDDPLLQS